MMRKQSKRILTGIVIILFLCGVLYAIAVARATAQLREAYATLKNNGRPMQPEDVIPPEIAATQNAAPQYEKAISLLKEQYVENKNLLEYLGNLSAQFHHEPSSVNRSEIKELLGRDVVAQALSSLERETFFPVCRFDRDYLPNDLKTRFPILEDLRNVVLILGAKARMESEGEKPGNAWNAIQAPLRLTTTLVPYPGDAGQWQRLYMTSYLCEVIQKICEKVRPSARDYKVVEDTLKKQADVALLVRALDAQRLLISERLFSMPADKLYETLNKTSAAHHRIPLYFRRATFKPTFTADHATYLQLMSKCVEFLQQPYAPRERKLYPEILSLAKSRLFTNILAPPIVATQACYCRAATPIQVTRAGVALLEYQERHDRFPETLDDLNLEGLIDPFTLKPLCYRIDGEGFSVYGVGEDLKDNGGLPPQPRQRTDYDVVWRWPGPKNEESRDL
jgi:hypothetical protein